MEKTILVTGASGFVGRAVVAALLRQGYHVRALVHHETSTFKEHPHLTRIVGDIRDIRILESTMVGVSAVVHTAAAKNDEKESYDINVHGAQSLIDACHIAGVQRVINISTQSTRLPRKGVYGSTKKEADCLFHASPLSVTTLRCSLIYGDVTNGIFGTIIRYCQLPIIPMIGNGKVTFRPIHRDDLAEVIVHALERANTIGNMYEVGGPDIVDLSTLTKKIMEAKRMHRPIVCVPLWIALQIARLTAFLPHPPITVSNVLGAAADVPMDMTHFHQDFANIHLRTLDEGMHELFNRELTHEEEEGYVLLQYVLSALTHWKPDSHAIALYQKAIRAHHLEGAPVPTSLLRTPWKLGAVDTASRIFLPESPLQKKLLIAAAVAETLPATANVLLPQDRTYGQITLQIMKCGMRIFWKCITAIPFIVARTPLKRNAGII